MYSESADFILLSFVLYSIKMEHISLCGFNMTMPALDTNISRYLQIWIGIFCILGNLLTITAIHVNKFALITKYNMTLYSLSVADIIIAGIDYIFLFGFQDLMLINPCYFSSSSDENQLELVKSLMIVVDLSFQI